MLYYKCIGALEVRDTHAIESLVGRVKDKSPWAIIEREGKYSLLMREGSSVYAYIVVILVLYINANYLQPFTTKSLTQVVNLDLGFFELEMGDNYSRLEY